MNNIYFLDSTSKYGFNTNNHNTAQGNEISDLVLEKWGGPLRAGRIQLSPGRWGVESYSLRIMGFDPGGGSGISKGQCSLKVRQPVPNFTVGFALKPLMAIPRSDGTGVVRLNETNQWLTFYDGSGIARHGVVLNRENTGTSPTGIAFSVTNAQLGWYETYGNTSYRNSPVVSFDPAKWNYYEFHVTSGNANTTDFRIKVNGQEVWRAGSGLYHHIQEVRINSNYTSVSGDMFIDGYYTDFYVADALIPGACTSRVWVPEHQPRGSSIMYQDMASGNRSQWGVVSDTVHYRNVDEKPHSSGDYIYAASTGLIDTFSFPTPSSVFHPVGNIHAIAVSLGLMPFGSTAEVKGMYFRPATTGEHYFTGGGVFPEGSYRVKQHIMNYNPMGTSVWLSSDIGSGVAQFGLVRTA